MSKAEHFRAWFFRHRHLLTGNGNWLQGHEPNCMPAEAAAGALVKVLIARLSSYHDVARGITHSFLYQLAESVPGCYVDMAFFPGDQDEKLLRKEQVPLWLGTTSKMPASEFDLIAISNSVLQELVNLPAALYYSGIPLDAAERARQNSPLIIIGGSNAYNLSILHSCAGAGLVDGVLVGDGELAFAEILEQVKQARSDGPPCREQLLKQLQQIGGFYLPQSYQQQFASDGSLSGINADADAPMPVLARKDAASEKSPCFKGGPILYDEESAGASHLLMTAGCPSFCSFCKESWEQKPYRERALPQLLATAAELKAKMGLSELALMSFNATTYSSIYELVRDLQQMFDRVSIKSQRFDTLVNAPELLELQFDAGKRTYTCAMEGISGRIRTLLQKNLKEEQILAGMSELMRLNMRQLKVFLIVSGYENAEDIEEFQQFLDKIKNLIKTGGSRATLMFSFACLFRPPHTPLQYASSRPGPEEMEKLLARLTEVVKKSGFEARVSSGPADACFSEFIAYADRRYLPVLVQASIEKGFRYRGEILPALYRFVVAASAGLGLAAPGPGRADTVFPWDDIDTGISKHFLAQTLSRLQNGRENTACIRPPWGSGSCSGCGACRSAEEMAELNGSGPGLNPGFRLPPPQRPVKLQLEFEVPPIWAWCGPKFLQAALARRLMLDNPELVKIFRRVSGILPGFYACGRAVAEIECSEMPEEIRTTAQDCCDDIKIFGRLTKKIAWPDGFWPVRLDAEGHQPGADFARKIDALLTRYRLKHLKQRRGDELHWEINKGQARKCGIEKISLHEKNGDFSLILLKMPELHLLNQIAAVSRLHCTRLIR